MQHVTPHPRFRLAPSATRLTVEAQTLVGLRLLRIATGSVAALAEIGRIVPEKVNALLEAQRIALLSVRRGPAAWAPGKLVRMYRRRGKANRRRLDKPTTMLHRRT